MSVPAPKDKERPLCSNCGKKPVLIKKRGLCSCCYQSFMYGSAVRSVPFVNQRPRHDRERDFVKNYFDHGLWEYEPFAFPLPNNTKFTPDFFDMKRNVFIEVAGTRQAYEQNRSKYKLFYETYPNIQLEIRTSDGELLKRSPTSKGLKWNDELPFNGLSRLNAFNPFKFGRPVGEDTPSAKLTPRDIINIRNDTRKQAEIAREYGITQVHVCRIKKGKVWSWLIKAKIEEG
jgi:hypothetical protein